MPEPFSYLRLATHFLIEKLPYQLFGKTYKGIAVACSVLTKFAYWAYPIGWRVGTRAFGGSAAAAWALVGKIGLGREVFGSVISLAYYPELRVLENRIVLGEGLRGHRAGQFAFVTSILMRAHIAIPLPRHGILINSRSRLLAVAGATDSSAG